MATLVEAKKSFWTKGQPFFVDTPKKNRAFIMLAVGLSILLVVLAQSGWSRLQADRYYSRAVALHESNHSREAVRAYKQVLLIDPDHVDANVGLGMLEVEKHPLAAIARYKKAIAVAPERSEAYACLAYAYFEKPGQSNEAIEQMKKAVRLEPRNYQYRLALGIFMSKTGRTGEAIDEFEAVVRLTPAVKMAHVKLIALYEQRGDKGNARLHRAMLKSVKFP